MIEIPDFGPILYWNLKGTKRVRKPMQGYIYVIQSGDFIKIGRSSSLEHRIKQIRTSNPNVKLLGKKWVLDVVGCEQKMHLTYAKHRAVGEWFKLSPGGVYKVLRKLRTLK